MIKASNNISIKICGLQNNQDVNFAKNHGVKYFGFVHFDKSPRHLSLEQIAEITSEYNANQHNFVIVCVNPSAQTIQQIVEIKNITHIQLHGDETASDVAKIKTILAGKQQIIKAIRVDNNTDLQHEISKYEKLVDCFLFDTKVTDDNIYGGSGKFFDWTKLHDIKINKPWFLSGGISADNIEQAVGITDAKLIDISSSVESDVAKKDYDKIANFMNIVNLF
jgi:phosphoribosylanthranilate isomerase